MAHWLVEVFIRRGAVRRFAAFTRKTTGLPVRVRWDRRLEAGESPNGQPERRTEPPFTWNTADFVIAERLSEDDAE